MNAAPQPISDAPPASDHLTDYDRSHLKTYLRLLDAAAEDATIVLGIDPEADPERAHRVHSAHLERARWMTRAGYRDLLSGRYAH